MNQMKYGTNLQCEWDRKRDDLLVKALRSMYQNIRFYLVEFSAIKLSNGNNT